jgi:aspartate aminotransferase
VPLAEDARRRGLHVHGLNIGQPDIPTPEVMWETLRASLPRTLAYSHSAGIPELREAFAKYYVQYGIKLDASQIIVTAGGSEALLFAIASVCDCGDEVIIPEPLYANYIGFSRMLSVDVRPVTCSAENGYHLPGIEEWEKRISPRTRAVLLCNPGNPTGTVYEEAEIEMAVGFARRHHLFLIVDEVYREFCYDGRKHKSIMTIPGIDDHVILVDSISKRFSACGARIGCLATRNREVFDTAMKLAQARLSPPGLGQIAAVPALSLPPSYYDGFVREFQARRDIVFELLSSAPGVQCRLPRGAFYLMCTLPVDDSESYVRWMLNEYQQNGETVMVAPGDGWYASPGKGKQEIRIAYVFEEKTLRRAVSILVESLNHYPGRRS